MAAKVTRANHRPRAPALSAGAGVAKRGGAGASRGRPNQVQRQDHQQRDGRIGQAGAAPAHLLHQQGAERPAGGACESAEQRYLGDRRAGLLAVQPAEGGEGRVVQPGAHAQAQHRPAGHEDGQGRGQPDHRQPRCQQSGAGRQHRPSAMRLDQPSHFRRDQPGDQQPERQRPADGRHRPASVRGNRRRQHRHEVVRRPPDQDLRRAEGADHDGPGRMRGQRAHPGTLRQWRGERYRAATGMPARASPPGATPACRVRCNIFLARETAGSSLVTDRRAVAAEPLAVQVRRCRGPRVAAVRRMRRTSGPTPRLGNAARRPNATNAQGAGIDRAPARSAP